MKEHNYACQNPDTRPRLQRRTQNICFVACLKFGKTSNRAVENLLLRKL